MTLSRYLDQIIQGDCLDVLADIETDSVDMVLTSPPYDNLRSYRGYHFPFEAIAAQLWRVIRPGGVVVWVVGDATLNGSETGTSFRQALHFRTLGFNLHDTMIFRKRNPVPQIYRQRYNNEFEYMFVFSKGRVTTHNPLMMDCLHGGLVLNGTTYKNYSRHEQKRGRPAQPVRRQKIRGNVWEYVVGKKKEDQEARGHPAPFPCELAQDHILSWTHAGDVVLDPLCGSGTSCRMAKQLGRHFIGIEISEAYCQIARQRLHQVAPVSEPRASLPTGR